MCRHPHPAFDRIFVVLLRKIMTLKKYNSRFQRDKAGAMPRFSAGNP
jgi:hypothetical protein